MRWQTLTLLCAGNVWNETFTLCTRTWIYINATASDPLPRTGLQHTLFDGQPRQTHMRAVGGRTSFDTQKNLWAVDGDESNPPFDREPHSSHFVPSFVA